MSDSIARRYVGEKNPDGTPQMDIGAGIPRNEQGHVTQESFDLLDKAQIKHLDASPHYQKSESSGSKKGGQ